MFEPLPDFLPELAGLVLFAILLAGGWWRGRIAQRRQRLLAVVGAKRVSRSDVAEKPADLVVRRLKASERRQQYPDRRRTLADRLASAGLHTQPRNWWIASFISAMLLTAIASLSHLPPIALFAAPFIGGLGLPRLVLAFLTGRRQRLFSKDLADAIEAIVRVLQAGLPVTEALAMIGHEFPGPVAVEFQLAVNEQKLGVSLSESLQRTAVRMPTSEMRMLALAVTIQSQTGGSLAETLTNLADVIRGRDRLRRKIRVVSSEARISAMILGSLPVFVASALALINPDYVGLLVTDHLGKIMLTFCITWMCMGTFVMWKMVNFKV